MLFDLIRPSWTRKTSDVLNPAYPSVWDKAFEEVELARKENRRPNPEVFVGLTKAPGEKR
jgi:hypothetical protein